MIFGSGVVVRCCRDMKSKVMILGKRCASSQVLKWGRLRASTRTR